MTALLITVDTELSALLQQRGLSLDENLRRSIHAETGGRACGIGWQMDVLDRHGLTGVFFLDPLPALVHGAAFLTPIVGEIAGMRCNCISTPNGSPGPGTRLSKGVRGAISAISR